MKPTNKNLRTLAWEAMRAMSPARLPAWQTTFRPTAILLLALGLITSCSMKGSSNPPATARHVELSRYSGRWFEIARLPMPFQKVGEAAIAEYGVNPDGTLSVRNIAVRADGSQHDIRGYAKVLNPPENTKLAVRFRTWFGPLIPVPQAGNYWVLQVDEHYQEAIVGTPDRKYLWLLARTATISEKRYAALVAKAAALGFDVSQLVRPSRHSSAESQSLP